MKDIRLLALPILLLMYSCYTIAQDTLVLPIVKGEHELPLPASGIEKGLIMESVVVSDSEKVQLNRKNSDHQFPLYLPRIMTLSEFTDYNYKREDSPFHDTVYASIFYQEEVGGMCFSMDINKNQDFLDDDVIPISENTPFRYDLTVSIPSTEHPKKEMILPLKIEYKSKSNEIWITNLLKYDVEYELADTSLQIELNVGTYYPNFSLLTPAPGLNKLIHQFYLLSEPFLFNDDFWMLQNLDIDKQTIELVRFPTNTRPKGYKQGYYVDLDSLFAGHGIPEEVNNRTDSSLFLLYFWGSWCQPCVKNMPKTNKIGQLAKGSDKLSMYGVAVMMSGQMEKDIREFEKEHTLTFSNFVESFDGAHPFMRKLLIMRYPSYYLLSSEGRIIHIGSRTKGVWNSLSQYGLDVPTGE